MRYIGYGPRGQNPRLFPPSSVVAEATIENIILHRPMHMYVVHTMYEMHTVAFAPVFIGIIGVRTYLSKA